MPKEFQSFYKTVHTRANSMCPYTTRLDTYGRGCQHNCAYCYARSLLNFRGLWNPEEPAVADIEKIRRRIKHIKPGSIVRLGGMTDCLQPIESKYGVTRATIALLNRAGVGYLIVTKSHLIATDEYLRLLDSKLAHIQISVTNTDDKAALEYEHCSLTSKRLDAIRTLQEAGIDVQMRLSPYIPGFIDPEVLDAYGVERVVVEFLRVNHWIRKWLAGTVDLSAWTLKSGAYFHLPLEKKIEAMKWLQDRLPAVEFTVGDALVEHWDYWRDNVNPNAADCCNLRGGNPLREW